MYNTQEEALLFETVSLSVIFSLFFKLTLAATPQNPHGKVDG